MVEVYQDGELVYPMEIKDLSYSLKKELNGIDSYIKFYTNGRCLSFSIFKKDTFGALNSLKLSHMNPNNSYCNKNYYYSVNGRDLEIETFVYGGGQGHYVISDYNINSTGDTLITTGDRFFHKKYKKQAIPVEWHNKYKVDW